MAVEDTKGNLKAGDPFVNEGLLGIQFDCFIKEEIDDFYGHKAIVPVFGGGDWIYGYSKWVVDEDDLFRNGFACASSRSVIIS